MRLRSSLAAAAILAGATVIAIAAMQMRPPAQRSADLPQTVNANSINRLATPPGLPTVTVDEPW